MQFPETEGVSFNMGRSLYDELFECEVEPYDMTEHDYRLQPAHVQFIQGMLAVEHLDEHSVYMTLSNDALEHFLRRTLPENMEMWSTWSSRQGQLLLGEAREILHNFGLTCPY